jgi:hypothetical protein
MSVLILEILVFLVFAALIGLAAGYWMRPARSGSSAAVAKERLQAPAATGVDPQEHRRVVALLETTEAERDAATEAADEALTQAAERQAAVQAELEACRKEAHRLREQARTVTDVDHERAALRNQLDSVREQLLAAQNESARLRMALQYAEADRDAAIEAASEDLARVESTTIQLDEQIETATDAEAPDPRRLRLLSPADELSSSEVRSLRSAASDLEAALVARDRIREDRDRLRAEAERLRSELESRPAVEDDAQEALEGALVEARQRLQVAEADNLGLRTRLEAAEAKASDVSRSLRRPANPLTVRFVPVSGPIGPDAREARVRLVLEMAAGAPWQLRARRVQVTLEFDLDAANIAINGRRSGPLVLAQDAELRPDTPMGIDLRVSTGAFSASVSQHRPSTPLGDHPVKVTVQFQLEPLGGRAGRAIARLAMPIVAG